MIGFDSPVLPLTANGEPGVGGVFILFALGFLLLGVLPIERAGAVFLLYVIPWGATVQQAFPTEDTQNVVFVGGLAVLFIAGTFQPYTWNAVLDGLRAVNLIDPTDTDVPGPGPNAAGGNPPQLQQAHQLEEPGQPPQHVDNNPPPDPADPPQQAAEPDHWTPDRMDLTAFEED